MDMLEFVQTNIGPVALRRHRHAESQYYTQVWRRAHDGEWKKTHYYSKDRSCEFSSDLLEALFRGINEDSLPYEGWW